MLFSDHNSEPFFAKTLSADSQKQPSLYKTKIEYLRKQIQAGELSPENFRKVIEGKFRVWDNQIIDDILKFDESSLRDLNTVPYPLPDLPPIDAFPYMRSSAEMIQLFYENARLTSESVCFDLGCGGGFPSFLTHLTTGCRTIGVELQPALFDAAQKLAASLNLQERVTFVNTDASKVDLSEGTHFYFFNPFRGQTMKTVVQNLIELSKSKEIYIHAAGWCSESEALLKNFEEVCANQIFRSKR